jgi:transposase
MRRVVDEAKQRLWRQRLARFARSGKTVAAFCSAEHVSVATFYHWKRKLVAKSGRRRNQRAGASSSVNRVAACSSGSDARAFLPVWIEGATLAELELPNGARVRVPARELAALGAAIAAAGRVPAQSEAETPRC